MKNTSNALGNNPMVDLIQNSIRYIQATLLALPTTEEGNRLFDSRIAKCTHQKAPAR